MCVSEFFPYAVVGIAVSLITINVCTFVVFLKRRDR
jgi:hypothetical protein